MAQLINSLFWRRQCLVLRCLPSVCNYRKGGRHQIVVFWLGVARCGGVLNCAATGNGSSATAKARMTRGLPPQLLHCVLCGCARENCSVSSTIL